MITTTYFAVVYRAQSAVAENISARTAEVKNLLETDAAQSCRVPQMLREIKQMKHRCNEKDLNRRLTERQELEGFLHEITSGLSGEKLSIRSIHPGNPSSNPRYNRLPITLKFEGDFLTLGRFLNRIDDMTRLTRIERLAISSDHNNENLEIEMGMNIYFTEQRTKTDQTGVWK
ncbi:MAG: type 4a pilus biogenesis protein PilO [Planctomycetota bacterium]|nr:type 4a pilus biogenesis protein PilO [Planctomycetota bacterium]